MTNLTRIFGEKPNTKFQDKYTKQIFTVSELNEGFLKPTIALGVDAMPELEEWCERFEKVNPQ